MSPEVLMSLNGDRGLKLEDDTRRSEWDEIDRTNKNRWSVREFPKNGDNKGNNPERGGRGYTPTE